MALSDEEYLQAINQYVVDTTAHQSEFRLLNEENFRFYNGDPFGNEKKNQSQAISTDAFDVVESDMPSMVRTILGSNDLLKFKPLNPDSPEDVQEANEKNSYIDHLVRGQKTSFQVLHGFIKDAEIQKFGAVKYYMDAEIKITTERWSGLSQIETQIKIADLEEQADNDKTSIESIEVVDPDVNVDDDINLEINVTRKISKVRIVGIPTENFLITKDASHKDDAVLVGDQTFMAKGELVAMDIKGWGRDKIKDLVASKSPNGNTMRDLRFRDQGASADPQSQGGTKEDWCSEKILVQNLYINIDKDGNGICGRRYVMKVGENILIDEPFDHVPYAMMSAILMPHSSIGKSRVDIVKSTQLEKSIIKRGIYNNIAQVNNPRTAVNTNKDLGRVNLDDLLTNKIRGIVRVDGPPQANVMPLLTPYIGDKALQVLQYADLARAQTTGALMASQGLNADSLSQESATRFNGIQDEGGAKTELVMRVYAETGFKDLYEGVAWLVGRFQDSEQEIRVLGKTLSINPTHWRLEHCCESQVGIAAGDSEELTANMGAVLNLLREFKAAGSPIADEVKIYNAYVKTLKAMGVSDIQSLANNPEVPQEQVQFTIEQLQAQNAQLTQMVEQLSQPNPLAEAELVKNEGKRETDNKKLAIEQAKLDNSNAQFALTLEQKTREFLAEMEQQQEKMRQDFITKMTELELENNVQLPGGAA